MKQIPPIRHERSEHRGEFVMEHDGECVGELTYSLAGQRMTILHTGVDASRCSYASAVFEKTPRYADVLAA